MPNRIKELRNGLGLTVSELSKRTGVAVGYLSELENDHTGSTNPTSATMTKIAEALQQTVPEIFYSVD